MIWILLGLSVIQSAAIALLILLWCRARRRAEKMRIDPVYGCLTRVGFEAAPPKQGSVIFFDIDRLHEANEQYGYDAVDTKICTALSRFRQSRGSSIVGRWYSGDELLAVVPTADVPQAAERMALVFQEQALSVTIGVAKIDSGDWQAAVREAASLVQAAKRKGDRGGIHIAQWWRTRAMTQFPKLKPFSFLVICPEEG